VRAINAHIVGAFHYSRCDKRLSAPELYGKNDGFLYALELSKRCGSYTRAVSMIHAT
jgi:hypothetical protein